MKYLLFALAFVATPVFAAFNMSLGGLLEFIIYLVVVGLIFWCIWWFIGFVGVPEPFNKVIQVVLGLVALIIVVNLLLGMVGSPLFTIR